MAAGIPIIASDFPVYKSIVEKHNCGLCVNPYNSQAISEAIDYIKNNKEKADLMRINGRNAVVAYYNWEMQVSNLLECYKVVIEKNKY
jgi:glycosyltransferase involved in cell wall biosynthesis